MQGKYIKRIWQCEYYMKIRHRQKVCCALLYPFFTLVSLAFRAVSVAAAVVADFYYTTTIAYIYVSTQCRRAAASKSA